MEQRIIRFFGTVQGVGFRYAACRAAGDFDLAGYVRNLPDGSVECLMEGATEEIDAFLAALRSGMGHYIRSEQQQTQPFSGRYREFDVKF